MSGYKDTSSNSDNGTASKYEVDQKHQRRLRLHYSQYEEENEIRDPATITMCRRTQKAFRLLRKWVTITAINSMAGLIVNIILREIRDHSGESDGFVLFLQVINTFLTLGAIFGLYNYYNADAVFQALSRSFMGNNKSAWPLRRIFLFSLEACILLNHDFPGINARVEVSTDVETYGDIYVTNPWTLLIFLRIYVLVRPVLHMYYSAGAKVLGLWHDFEFTIPFTTRNMLASHPFAVLLPFVIVVIFTCSYSMLVCERERPDFNISMDDAIWLTVITMTGVGYGDLFPVTTCGRGVSMISAFLAIFTIAIIIASVQQGLTLLPYEARMVEFLERSKTKDKVKLAAANLIGATYKLSCLRRGKSTTSSEVTPMNKLATSHTLHYGANESTIFEPELWLAERDYAEAIYTFDSAVKATKAYDRRFHANQLFRNMLEDLQIKIEDLSLQMLVQSLAQTRGKTTFPNATTGREREMREKLRSHGLVPEQELEDKSDHREREQQSGNLEAIAQTNETRNFVVPKNVGVRSHSANADKFKTRTTRPQNSAKFELIDNPRSRSHGKQRLQRVTSNARQRDVFHESIANALHRRNSVGGPRRRRTSIEIAKFSQELTNANDHRFAGSSYSKDSKWNELLDMMKVLQQGLANIQQEVKIVRNDVNAMRSGVPGRNSTDLREVGPSQGKDLKQSTNKVLDRTSGNCRTDSNNPNPDSNSNFELASQKSDVSSSNEARSALDPISSLGTRLLVNRDAVALGPESDSESTKLTNGSPPIRSVGGHSRSFSEYRQTPALGNVNVISSPFVLDRRSPKPIRMKHLGPTRSE